MTSLQVPEQKHVTMTPPVAPTSRSIRLAYLTTEYPKVSHTFIRREIHELERRGHSVLRVALRGGAVADAMDQEESAKTFHCFSQSPVSIARSCLGTLGKPAWLLSALRAAQKMNKVSERGSLRHAAYLAEAAVLLRELQRHRVEHLHVHFGTNSAAVGRLIRKLGGPPYSMTVHGPDEFDSPRGFSLAEKINDAEFVVAISDFCAAQIRRWVPHQQWSKIHVVRCCVGAQFFEQAAPIEEGCRTLVSVGRLTPQKGQLLLLDAAHTLMSEGVDFQLVLAGDGEMRPEIDRRIDQLRLRNRVHVTGWLDEQGVRKHILQARALVQPSFAEGLPVVIMEALALRRPVISTAIAGIPELVKHGENGWLVPAGNVDELVAAMRRCLRAPVENLWAMARSGQQRVRDMHSITSEGEKLEDLFVRSIQQQGSR